ncbi:Uma2 family endonuclease [Streptomyces roseoverticillatus]|uniref:Uma2 family endonuclease n=1 Tax=Streptomyces roseoverticillatus TaxID=66429 RepID=UPI001F1B4A52|nr:Uma2 family endonuclease [Streptomyces roseoverticillatus]MCF3103857.1 Uma2 family endonuclease [Streptomyces roseoverticillatus]
MTISPVDANWIDPGWVSSIQDDLDSFDLPKRMKIRYSNGAFLMVPVTTAHFDNSHALVTWARGIPGVRGVGEFRLVPAIDGYKPEPDFALIVEGAHSPGRSEYEADEVLFIAEIVSTESEQRDYTRKNIHYAKAGIQAYLVVDVLSAEWTLFTEPRDGAYTLSSSGPFGKQIPVEVNGSQYPIDSGEFEHL